MTGKGFQPGQSGNAGPKPTIGFARRVKRDLLIRYDSLCPVDKPLPNLSEAERKKWKPRTWGEVLGERAFVNAAKGNGAILHEIYDRIDGKVPTPVNIQGPEGGPIEVQFDYSKLSDSELELLESVIKKTILVPPEDISDEKEPTDT